MAKKEKVRTPSRTLFEKCSDDEIISRYGQDGFFIAFIKSLTRHDSDRHVRRRRKSEKRLKRNNNRYN
jgi:hypothetical protein